MIWTNAQPNVHSQPVMRQHCCTSFNFGWKRKWEMRILLKSFNHEVNHFFFEHIAIIISKFDAVITLTNKYMINRKLNDPWRDVTTKGKHYVLAARSHSMRHSRTRIREWTMPRLSRSADVRLPEYVGRMSLPISSITASSCAYLLWCCCDAAALDRAAKLVGIVNCGGGVFCFNL